jgi:hypothetical protein
MFYLYEFCLKNMWICSLTQQILSHSLLKQIGPKRIQNTIADFQINCNGHLIKIQSSIKYLAVDIYQSLSG